MAELDVKERQAGDVTILDLSGEVRIGEGSIALRDAIRNLADEGKKKILLNLGGSQVHRLEWYRRVDRQLHDCQPPGWPAQIAESDGSSSESAGDYKTAYRLRRVR